MNRIKRVVATFGILCWAVSPAFAQDSPPAAEETPAAAEEPSADMDMDKPAESSEPAAEPAASDDTADGDTADGDTDAWDADGAAEKARFRDASIDRGFIFSRAETLPEGKVALNSYELLGIGVSYGVTNDVEVSFISLLPIVADMPLVASPSVKWAFQRTEQQVLSAKLSLNYITSDGSGAGNLSAGVYLDHYFDTEGRYSLHLGAEFGGVFGNFSGDVDFAEGMLILFDVGFSAQVSDGIKLMIEALIPAVYTGSNGFQVPEFLNVTYGVRWFGEDLSVDLGFLRPVASGVSDVLVMGIPYVAFSGRL